MTARSSSVSPKGVHADVPLLSPGSDFLPRTIPSNRSISRRWKSRLAVVRTRSGAFRSGIPSNSTGSRIGGAPTCGIPGVNNFDTIRYEYYRDREVGFEGFTAKSYLFREEFTSRTGPPRYEFRRSRMAASSGR